jgi:hypothetical protein
VQTYWGNPSMTGSRMKALVGWWPIERAAEYFSFRVVSASDHPFHASENRYIFGFAPHGIMPVSVAYGTRTLQVGPRSAGGGRHPCSLLRFHP